MTKPVKVDTLEDCRMWIAEHHGRTEAWWVQQRALNVKTEASLEQLTLRISSIEKRMMWIAGFAAAVGSLLGNLIMGGLQ